MQKQMMPLAKELVATSWGRVFVALWLFALLLFAGLALCSYFQGELLGGFAFALLPTAVLINASVVLSFFLTNRGRAIAKASWVFLNVAAIAVILAGVNPSHPDASRDSQLILNYIMFTLSFPFGFIGPLILWLFGSTFSLISSLFGKAELLPSAHTRFYASNIAIWFSFFVVGYFQWFVLFPYVVRRRQRRTEGTHSQL